MLINHNINNLCGGVSRQPQHLRFDNQVEEMLNFMPTSYGKVITRKPCRRLATIGSISTEAYATQTYEPIVKTHSYDRGDGSEKYGMFLQQTKQIDGTFIYSLRVFNNSGIEHTVNTLNYDEHIGGVTYDYGNGLSRWKSILSGIKLESSDIEFLTVGDTTWLLNKKIIPIMQENSLSASYSTNKAFYWVQKSFDDGNGGGYTYEVVLDGKKFTATGTSSLVIAKNMKDAIRGTYGDVLVPEHYNDMGIWVESTYGTAYAHNTEWEVYVNGSIVMIKKFDDTPFTFAFGDSWGNQASKGWTNKVAKISDLPSKMDGFTTEDVGVVIVEGTSKDDHNNYYVKWDGQVWVETVKEGIANKISMSFMPLKIVRQSNGSFSVGYMTNYTLSYTAQSNIEGFSIGMAKRLKGDDDSCPIPSFIGNSINGIFFYKNRLGFISEENVILSEAGDYYNFFGTTAMEVVDSDPIDVSIDSNEVSNIKYVTPMAGALTLWTDNGQYLLQGGEILSPATVNISKTSSYDCDLRHKPLTIDNEIIFFNSTSDSFDAYVYSPASLNSDTSTAECLTSHIPSYLPSLFDMCVASSEHNIVIMKPSGLTKYLYCYKYHISNGQRIMSAWFKYKLLIYIDTINIIGSNLFIISKPELSSTTRAIMTMDLSEKQLGTTVTVKDTREDGISDELAYEDRRIDLSKFSLETSQKSKIFTENIYLKKIEVSSDTFGMIVHISNSERQVVTSDINFSSSNVVHLSSRADKVNLSLYSYNTEKECSIGAINILASINGRSKNI